MSALEATLHSSTNKGSKVIMGNEKRKCRRYPFLAIASLDAISNGPKKTATSLINNISYAGIGLTSYTLFSKGTPVSIRMQKIMGADNNEHLSGTITYSYKQKDSYHMGIELDEELNPEKQPELCEQLFKTIKFG